jgi:long-chain acyl-CoA synthetase
MSEESINSSAGEKGVKQMHETAESTTGTYPVCRPDRGIFPLSELADRSARDFGPHPVMRAWNGQEYEEITYDEFAEKIRVLGRWLIDYGIKPGDRVAVLGENRSEWGITYLGVEAAGAVIVPVDRLLPAPGIRHVISHSGARLLFTSQQFVDLFGELAPIPGLETIICFDECGVENVAHWPGILEQGAESSSELPTRTLDDLAAILYTSGTTGHSKGVMLSQGNLMTNVAGCSQLLPLGPDDTFLSMLPMHHSFACTAGFLFPVYCGCSITFARSFKSTDILADIRETNVTAMGSVPLFYEKLHAGILRNVRKKGTLATWMFGSLYGTVQAGERFNKSLGSRLFRGLRKKAGLGSMRYFVTGGAPHDPATTKFFERLGIPLLPGFGLTETSPVTHATPPTHIRHDCVGLPLPNVMAKIIDPDENGVGELCIKGPTVFSGYYKNEEATREALDDEEWLRTGDLGIIRADGYLQITGRKKNLLVTAGGKNVYPEEIEMHLNRSRFVAESLVVGVTRNSGYGDEVGVLIHPDYEQLDLHFEQSGTTPTDEDVNTLIKAEIRAAQHELPAYKHVRYFRILEEEFQKTTTRKIKRFLYTGDLMAINGHRL